MKRDNHRSLPIQVKEAIALDVMQGELLPGDKILEEAYAAKLGVSRAPIREAILMLIAEGIAHKIENRGTFVKKYTLSEYEDLYNLRFFLERKAIDKLKKLTDFSEIIHHLKDLSRQMHEEDPKNLDMIGILNYNFHYQFIRFSGSKILQEKYPSFFTSIQFVQREAYDENGHDLKAPLAEHDDLISALEDRDFDRFLEIFKEHCRATFHHLFTFSQKKEAAAIISSY